ncbi:hypothetical protein CEN50_14945 [Fischerella thermalis CCMEE 5268]|uniref:Uncharacterized protein n=1 Tax=Fischerella thermalis CCMEE 5268 TaxID=2019662 RepID=A0A2N6KEU4_9CYAN|nr:hypothetical protein CEN50_14945 [Fischerella thermalis CCMEE 5268]
MDRIDVTLLTLISTIACLTFPKLLSIITDPKIKPTRLLQKVSTPRNTQQGITSFPFCTSYALTGSPSCKFSPHFCGRCSPN